MVSKLTRSVSDRPLSMENGVWKFDTALFLPLMLRFRLQLHRLNEQIFVHLATSALLMRLD